MVDPVAYPLQAQPSKSHVLSIISLHLSNSLSIRGLLKAISLTVFQGTSFGKFQGRDIQWLYYYNSFRSGFHNSQRTLSRKRDLTVIMQPRSAANRTKRGLPTSFDLTFAGFQALGGDWRPLLPVQHLADGAEDRERQVSRTRPRQVHGWCQVDSPIKFLVCSWALLLR